MIGQTIGQYRVVSELGVGGMGVVYRAHDPKLARDVAIKVLPPAFVDDHDRRSRFEREARLLASLNHPHIGAIYGFEEHGRVAALVLELVEGPTLADRIAHGRVPPRESLVIARQIADALDAAHERGIVHRDLKPSNIKLTPEGIVKVLDFGLAKSGESPYGAAELTHSPTMTMGGTRDGVLLGTAAYMSPEQARGHAVDKRADIWALGCVLFEMLSGRAAFGRETITDTLAALIEREPDWSVLPADTPPPIRRLLQRCLVKDPKGRLRDIADARAEIDDVLAGPRAPSTASPRPRRWIALASAAAAVVALVAAWRLLARAPRGSAPGRASFVQLTSAPGIEWFPSVSPDGGWIVYGGDADGSRDIYLQSVTGQNPINLTRDSPADDDEPAFSPDGERIVFRSSRENGGIFVMGRTGEAVRRVTHDGFNPSWSPGGDEIVYASENIDINPQNSTGRSALWIARVAGGEPRLLDAHVRDAVMPSWSPHGRRIAYMARFGSPARQDIHTIPAAGGTPVPVTDDAATDWNPVWSPDGRFLYFSSDRAGSMNLWRVEIDEASGRPRGDPQPITTPASFVGHLSISTDGRRIVFASVARSANVNALPLNAADGTVAGAARTVTSGTRTWSNPDPSPDGRSVAFYSGLNPVGHVYVQGLDGTGLRQLTSDSGVDRMPHWSPDGQWLLFFSNRGSDGVYELWKIRPDGSDLQQVTYAGQASYADWSPDGRRIATTILSTQATRSTTVVVFDAARPWREQAPETLPRMSDGRDFFVTGWTADGGRLVGQVGPGPNGAALYSFDSRQYERLTDFGEWPTALPDGRHVLFVSGGHGFFVADAATGAVKKIYSVDRDVIGPPRLTRDGRLAYFIRRVTESDVWLVTLDEVR